MPDFFSAERGAAAPLEDALVQPGAAKAARKVTAAAPATPTKRRGQRALKYGGALTSALAQTLAREPQKQTKEQLAESVLGEVIAAINAFPGVKPKKLWPILKELDPENDGATFRRAINRALKKEAENQPVIALSLQSRARRTNTTAKQPATPIVASAAPKSEASSIQSMASALSALRGSVVPKSGG